MSADCEILELLLGEEGVEELLDDLLVVVFEPLDLLKLPHQLPVLEASLGSALSKAVSTPIQTETRRSRGENGARVR